MALPLCLLAGAALAHASTYTVNALTDTGTGTGTSGDLRYVLTQVNLDSTADTVTFSSGLTGTITLTSALPAITNNVTITGPGANAVTISGAGAYTVFTINASTVNISGLTIANGYAATEGGGIVNNSATLTVTNCVFLSNKAVIFGGAIFNNAALNVGESTFYDNSAISGGGAIENYGNFNAVSLTVTNSTFTSNTSGSGGAIENGAARTGNNHLVGVIQSTFYGNTATAGGAIENDPTLGGNEVVGVTNSLFSGNKVNSITAAGAAVNNSSGGPEVNASFNVFWNNTDIGGSEDDCNGCSSNSNTTDADPLLLPIGNFGGTMPTQLTQPGSSAICAGSNALAIDWNDNPLPYDQRGFPRITSGCVDVGATQANYLMVNNLTDTDDDGYCTTTTCSIVDALYQAEDNGGLADIGFQSELTGTILLTNPLPAIQSGEEIEIIGPGATTLTVSGGNSPTVGSVFQVSAGAESYIYGLTIADGNGVDGGGIYSGGALTVNNCTLSGNFASSNAGAIAGETGSLTIAESTFYNNSTTNNAGAVLGGPSVPLAVSGSTFYSNSAGSNAGGILAYAALAVSDSTFYNNSASGDAGGILTDSVFTASNSTFDSNSAVYGGGEHPELRSGSREQQHILQQFGW